MKMLIKSIFLFLMIVHHGYSQQAFINSVPDYSQPPANNLPSTLDVTNYCAPFAFMNIIDYWESIQMNSFALGVMGGLLPDETAEYIGWFMDTNNNGNPTRLNGNPFLPAQGTYFIDQVDGTFEYIVFDNSNPFGFPYNIPSGKRGFTNWIVFPEPFPSFPLFSTEIDSGNPVKVDFLYWKLIPTGFYLYDPFFAADTIYFYLWGDTVNASGSLDPADPPEIWNLEPGDMGIGHAVTGVGYFANYIPPGSTLPPADYIIVHDNWSNTPQNIAIPWQNVSGTIMFNLPEVPDLAVTNIRTAIDTAAGFIDSLKFGEPVTVCHTIKNLTTRGVQPLILVTQVYDPDWIKIAEDTLIFAPIPTNVIRDSIKLYSDSLFIPQKSGDYEIISHVFWDQNVDSLINDPPDADPANDLMSIQRYTNYNVIYTSYTLIPNVPDVNQPPTVTLPSTIPDNFCAPTAAVNITEYWDVVKGHANAANVNAGFIPETAAEYIGWFMDTNDLGNPNANNGKPGYPGSPGTYTIDQDTFLYDYIRWNIANPYPTPATPSLPATKMGYNWIFNSDYNSSSNIGFPFYKTEIDSGRPAKIDFLHWNIFFTGTLFIDSLSQDTVYLYNWGNPVNNSAAVDSLAPPETWNLEEGLDGIGHAVTGVGYIIFQQTNHAIVHDNWPTTHKNIVIPWSYWNATMSINPGSPVVSLNNDDNTVKEFRLKQNYPNPFNPTTNIEFQIPGSQFVTLKIYNLLGQEVVTLVSEKMKAGKYIYSWDASAFTSGIYYYTIQAGEFVQTKKLLFIK